MKVHLDQTWAAVDDTLLDYLGGEAVVQVPQRLDAVPIRAIGDGAFMGAGKPLQIALPSSVRRVGSKAFHGCQNLRNIYLPGSIESFGAQALGECPHLMHLMIYDLPLSRGQYESLKAVSALAEGGIRVARAFPDFKVVREALAATGCKPAKIVPQGIERLYVSQSLVEDAGRASLGRNLDQYVFDASGKLNEEEAFQRLISAGGSGFLEEKEAERKNDAFMRLEKYLPIERTAVFTFADDMTKAEGDTRSITACVKIGCHFWQSAATVRYEGVAYSVYRRHYLSGKDDLSYIRRDVAIFTGNGLVENRNEAREVYAKYKLLSIL